MMKTDYKSGQRAFNDWLVGHGLKLVKVNELGLQRDDDGWEHFAWALTVTNYRNSYVKHGLQTDEGSFEFPFKQGTAHTKKPTLVDITAALLSDAETIINTDSFEDWAANLGYDTDSRKAEETYRQIQVNTGRLLRLFRTTDLAALLKKYEPLREAAGL